MDFGMRDDAYYEIKFTRRQFLRISTTSIFGLMLAACGVGLSEQDSEILQTQELDHVQDSSPDETESILLELEPTPACDDDDEPTLRDVEGPFYSPETPRRTSFLKDGSIGTTLVLSGKVLGTNCEPVAGAILDFWHADGDGEYDNVGYRYRGHQFSDVDGSYRLETIFPGLYPGRTRHFHVKVQGPNTALLTTQLYFPGEPSNGDDIFFRAALLMDVREQADGGAATFDFVLSSE